MHYKDQLLEFHRVSRRKFELSGLRTGSIRDQLLRASAIVRRLFDDAQLIGPRSSLLVVGGGAAGACAALTASQLGVQVVLVEQELGKRLFQRQSIVTTRFIDPIEYDWPHQHWRPGVGQRAIWPIRKGHLPLEFEAGLAADIAAKWQIDFDTRPMVCPATGLPVGNIDVLDGINGRSLTFKEDAAVGVHVTGLTTGTPQTFGAVLSCIGFRGEQVEVKGLNGSPCYKGYEYWADDPFDQPYLGVTGRPKKIRALVSGGGDGALQDFQRITTRSCGRALFERIEAEVAKLGAAWVSKEHYLEILAAEDCGKRAHAWRANGTRPSVDLKEWHSRVKAVADSLLHRWASASVINRVADKVVLKGVEVTLLLRYTEPDYCFALNRFLVYILLGLIRHTQNRSLDFASSPSGAWNTHIAPLVICDWSICNITCGTPGVNLLDPDSSHGVAKTVFIAPRATKRADLQNASVPLGDFEIIIVRHGVDSKPLFRGGARIPEQIMPFHDPY